MAEVALSLLLNPAQRSQFFAHLLTYLFCLTANPPEAGKKAPLDLIQEVAYRLFEMYGDSRDERQKTTFFLSSEEAQAVKDALNALQPQYEQWSPSETSAFALEHLAACRLLIEEAEQQASTRAESR